MNNFLGSTYVHASLKALLRSLNKFWVVRRQHTPFAPSTVVVAAKMSSALHRDLTALAASSEPTEDALPRAIDAFNRLLRDPALASKMYAGVLDVHKIAVTTATRLFNAQKFSLADQFVEGVLSSIRAHPLAPKATPRDEADRRGLGDQLEVIGIAASCRTPQYRAWDSTKLLQKMERVQQVGLGGAHCPPSSCALQAAIFMAHTALLKEWTAAKASMDERYAAMAQALRDAHDTETIGAAPTKSPSQFNPNQWFERDAHSHLSDALPFTVHEWEALIAALPRYPSVDDAVPSGVHTAMQLLEHIHENKPPVSTPVLTDAVERITAALASVAFVQGKIICARRYCTFLRACSCDASTFVKFAFLEIVLIHLRQDADGTAAISLAETLSTQIQAQSTGCVVAAKAAAEALRAFYDADRCSPDALIERFHTVLALWGQFEPGGSSSVSTTTKLCFTLLFVDACASLRLYSAIVFSVLPTVRDLCAAHEASAQPTSPVFDVPLLALLTSRLYHALVCVGDVLRAREVVFAPLVLALGSSASFGGVTVVAALSCLLKSAPFRPTFLRGKLDVLAALLKPYSSSFRDSDEDSADGATTKPPTNASWPVFARDGTDNSKTEGLWKEAHNVEQMVQQIKSGLLSWPRSTEEGVSLLAASHCPAFALQRRIAVNAQYQQICCSEPEPVGCVAPLGSLGWLDSQYVVVHITTSQDRKWLLVSRCENAANCVPQHSAADQTSNTKQQACGHCTQLAIPVVCDGHCILSSCLRELVDIERDNQAQLKASDAVDKRKLSSTERHQRKEEWWTVRQAMDSRIKGVVTLMHESLLGCWRGALLGSIADVYARKELRRIAACVAAELNEIVPAKVEKGGKKKKPSTASAAVDPSLVYLLLSAVPWLSPELCESGSFTPSLVGDHFATSLRRKTSATFASALAPIEREIVEALIVGFGHLVSLPPCPLSTEEAMGLQGEACSQEAVATIAANAYQSVIEVLCQCCEDAAGPEAPADARDLFLLKRQHVFLVLDDSLHSLPWEALPVLAQQSVSRVPNLQFVREQLERRFQRTSSARPLQPSLQGGNVRVPSHSVDHAACCRGGDPFLDGVSRNGVVYVVNSSGDMKSTEKRFAPLFQREGWQGWARTVPPTQELIRALQTKSLYLYLGHHTGERVLHRKDLLLTLQEKWRSCRPLLQPQQPRQNCSHVDSPDEQPEGAHVEASSSSIAAVMLMGCSSAKLVSLATASNPSSMPYAYLLSGAPVCVGCLWDVTDGEIDRMTQRILEHFFNMPAAPTESEVEKGNRSEPAVPQCDVDEEIDRLLTDRLNAMKLRETATSTANSYPAATTAASKTNNNPVNGRLRYDEDEDGGGGGVGGGEGEGEARMPWESDVRPNSSCREKAPNGKVTLTAAIARARSSCRLRYFTGASVVAYGMPVQAVTD